MKDLAHLHRHLAKLPPQTSLTLNQLRAQYERAERAFALPAGTRVEHVQAPLAPAEWLRPAGAGDAVLLYLHGGGYVIGSPRSHRHLVAAIAGAAGLRALVPEYRLAPEHPFPAALDDAVAAYRWLVGQAGVAPARIVIGGDSAGGGLTISTLLALRDAGDPLPAAAVCLSPWVDLSFSLPSCQPGATADPVLDAQVVRAMAQAYLDRCDARQPLASPLFADLRGLPPLLIQVGGNEALLDDSRALAARASRANVQVTLEVWPDMVHVWQWFAPIFDGAQPAIDRLGEFIRQALRPTPG